MLPAVCFQNPMNRRPRRRAPVPPRRPARRPASPPAAGPPPACRCLCPGPLPRRCPRQIRVAPQHQEQLHAVVVQQRRFKSLVQSGPVAGVRAASCAWMNFSARTASSYWRSNPADVGPGRPPAAGSPPAPSRPDRPAGRFPGTGWHFRPAESRLHQGVIPVHAVRLSAVLFRQLHTIAAPAAERARLFVAAGQRRNQMNGVHAPALRQGQQLRLLQSGQFRVPAVHQGGKFFVRRPQHQIHSISAYRSARR